MNRRLTVGETADALNVSVETVRRAIRSGELKAYKVGRQFRIDPADIDASFAYEPSRGASPRYGGSPVTV